MKATPRLVLWQRLQNYEGMSWHCWSMPCWARPKIHMLQRHDVTGLDHCSLLCISSRMRRANCCISKDPSIWTFKSAVATRIAGRSGVQTPWSSSNPETSICSPEWIEALSATATSQDRLLLTHFQHTRWSLSQMEHSPVGACDEVSQASQKALLHIPQRSQGAGLTSEFSSKTGLVWTANAARAPMSTSLRVLGNCKILTSGCLEIQPWAKRLHSTKIHRSQSHCEVAVNSSERKPTTRKVDQRWVERTPKMKWLEAKENAFRKCLQWLLVRKIGNGNCQTKWHGKVKKSREKGKKKISFLPQKKTQKKRSWRVVSGVSAGTGETTIGISEPDWKIMKSVQSKETGQRAWSWIHWSRQERYQTICSQLRWATMPLSVDGKYGG